MFSYRHAFHAGNHADVLKHTVLIAMLRHLLQKDTALTVFDTHAGAGLYRLDGEYAETSGEAAMTPVDETTAVHFSYRAQPAFAFMLLTEGPRTPSSCNAYCGPNVRANAAHHASRSSAASVSRPRASMRT